MSVQSEVGQVDLTAEPSVGDFIQLMKPRVMTLVILTALAAMLAAPGSLNPVIGTIAMISIAIGAGASGALNMWYDADIDARMARTAARPLPRGRVTPEAALSFGTVLSFGSVLTLGVLVNWMAGALFALTIAFYVFVYTMWLKRSTPQNIVIGGAAGAFPPMIGWAAVTGTVSLDSLLLFLIIFMWTPPHFWALALYRCRDYERVGVPMLPVVAGLRRRGGKFSFTRFCSCRSPLCLTSLDSAASLIWSPRSCSVSISWACHQGLSDDRRPRGRYRGPATFLVLDSISLRAVHGASCRGNGQPDDGVRFIGRMDEVKNERQDLAAERIRRRRSIAIALTLGFMVLAFYLATFVRFGEVVANRVL